MSARILRRDWVYSALVFLAMASVIVLYRNAVVPASLCTRTLVDAGDGTQLSLPRYLRAESSESRVLSLQHQFPGITGGLPQAIYIGMTAPFVEVHVNARNLTPEIDLARRDYRSSAPRLYLIPEDTLQAGDNLLTLRVPLNEESGAAIIGTVCVGDAAELQPIWLANWWRQVGVLLICIALLVVLGHIAMILWSLYGRPMEWSYYLAAVVLAAYRPLYLVVGAMPGGPQLWRTVSDLSFLLFIFVVHRLLLAFWRIAPQSWSTLVMLGLTSVRVVMLLTDLSSHRWLELTFWLGTAAIACVLAGDVLLRARRAPRIERLCLYWALGFAIACAVLELLAGRINPMQGLRWISPLGMTVLVATIGFLLIRRTTTGTRLLNQAAHMLDVRLDAALPIGRASSITAWNRISDEIAGDERGRMLDVIDEGFGARMLAVLTRIRDEMPNSRLSGEIQRALLDLRLMVDAIDASAQSIGGALDLLRQRMEAPLAAAGLRSQWQIDGMGAAQVSSRRRLAEVFRCVEELLSNVIQHAQAHEVRISAHRDHAMLELVIEDDGRGVPEPICGGRGLRNLHTRMETLGGSFSIASREDGSGTRATLRVARI